MSALERKQKKQPLYRILCLAGAGLSVLLVTAVTIGWVAGQGWLVQIRNSWTSMPFGVALAFALLAVPILALSGRVRRFYAGKTLLILTGVAGLGVSVMLWQSLLSEEMTEVRRKLQLEAEWLAETISHDFQVETNALDRMAARWVHSGGPPQSWISEAGALIGDSRVLRAVAWLDQDAVIREIAPPGIFDAALNLDIDAMPQMVELRQRSLARAAMTFSPPSELILGGAGMFVLIPLGTESRFGILGASIKLSDWLSAIIDQRVTATGRAAVQFEGRDLFGNYAELAKASEDLMAHVRFQVGDHHWTVGTGMDAKAFNVTRSALPEVVLGAGLLSSALVIWALYLMRVAQRNAADTADAHQVLEDAYRLREIAERRNRLLLDCAGEGIYGLDQSGCTTFVNPAAARMLGYRPDELIGRSMHEVAHHSYPDGSPYPQEQCAMFASLHDGTVRQVDDEVLWRKDGQSLPVEYSSTPIREFGKITGAVVVFRDLTQLRLQQRELQHTNEQLLSANAELEEFAYVASHDLKSPLQGIEHLAQWIMEDLGEDASPEISRNMQRLTERVTRLQKLISDLLCYSRAGRGQYAIEQVTTSELVAQIDADLDASPRFQIRVRDQVGAFSTARIPLETILRNLISNAISHHHADRGQIEVSCVRFDDQLRFSVSDDGPGIAPDYRERIFKLFETLSAPDGNGGTGMGLAIVKRLVEKYQGRISLKIADERCGCTFEFTWPRTLAASEHAA